MRFSKTTSCARHARVPERVFSDKRFSSNEKLVLAVLNLYSNSRGECYPSLKRIAEKTSLGRRTVISTLKGLSEKAAIERIRRKKEGKRENDTTLYRLAEGLYYSSCAVEKDEEPGERVRQAHESSATVAPRVVRQPHPNLTNGTAQSTLSDDDDSISESSGISALPPEFLEAAREIFQDLLKLYPKPDTSREAFALFCGIFTEDEELNDRRVSNILGQALNYAEQCEGREFRYVKSLRNWLREVDPDIALERSVLEWRSVEDE